MIDWLEIRWSVARNQDLCTWGGWHRARAPQGCEHIAWCPLAHCSENSDACPHIQPVIIRQISATKLISYVKWVCEVFKVDFQAKVFSSLSKPIIDFTLLQHLPMLTIFSRHQYLVWEYYKIYFPKFSGAKSSSHLSVAALEEGDALEHVGGGGGGLLLLLLLLHASHHLLHQWQSRLCLFVCCFCWNSKLRSLHHSLPAIEAANFHLKYEIFVEIQNEITRNLKKWGTWLQNLQTLCDHSTLSEITVFTFITDCFIGITEEILPFHHSPIFPTYRHYWFHNGWMQGLSDWICTFSRSGWICTFSHTNLQTGWISHQNLHLWNQI